MRLVGLCNGYRKKATHITMITHHKIQQHSTPMSENGGGGGKRQKGRGTRQKGQGTGGGHSGTMYSYFEELGL